MLYRGLGELSGHQITQEVDVDILDDLPYKGKTMNRGKVLVGWIEGVSGLRRCAERSWASAGTLSPPLVFLFSISSNRK